MRSRLWLTGLALVLGAGGCRDEGQVVVCAPALPDAVHAITVSVRDSVTGAAAADGATGVAVAAAFRDTLVGVDSLRLRSIGSRDGVYTLRITKPGYAPWVAEGVDVRLGGGCFPTGPRQLQARLQPDS